MRLTLAGTRVDNVLHVPRQAIFEKDGKPIVYMRVGDRFEPRTVKPTRRTESRVAIDGVAEGSEVALANPESVTRTKSPASAATAGVQK